MVDVRRLTRILTRVRQDLGTLRGYAEADPEALRRDEVRLGHVKYLFVTLMEGCIDAAHHVCASEGWGPPDTNADAMRVLARNGVLPDDLAGTMGAGVGFRNVLVHRYADVRDALVVSHLERLDDVERFVGALAELLDRDGAEPDVGRP